MKFKRRIFSAIAGFESRGGKTAHQHHTSIAEMGRDHAFK
jgi:hypothetical protein